MDKYEHELEPKSNLYCRYQMLEFLSMQLGKEEDNPGLSQQSLA